MEPLEDAGGDAGMAAAATPPATLRRSAKSVISPVRSHTMTLRSRRSTVGQQPPPDKDVADEAPLQAEHALAAQGAATPSLSLSLPLRDSLSDDEHGQPVVKNIRKRSAQEQPTPSRPPAKRQRRSQKQQDGNDDDDDIDDGEQVKCSTCGGSDHKTSRSRRCLAPGLLFRRLPIEVLQNIVLLMDAPGDVVSFSRVCKATAGAMSYESVWAAAWRRVVRTANINVAEVTAPKTPRYLMQLYGQIGCQRCQRQRIRKIYPYGIRVCTDCLHEITIAEVYVRSLGLDRTGLSTNSTGMWSRWNGSYTVTFYLKKDLEQRCLEQYGMSMAQRRSAADAEAEARAIAHQEMLREQRRQRELAQRPQRLEAARKRRLLDRITKQAVALWDARTDIQPMFQKHLLKDLVASRDWEPREKVPDETLVEMMTGSLTDDEQAFAIYQRFHMNGSFGLEDKKDTVYSSTHALLRHYATDHRAVAFTHMTPTPYRIMQKQMPTSYSYIAPQLLRVLDGQPAASSIVAPPSLDCNSSAPSSLEQHIAMSASSDVALAMPDPELVLQPLSTLPSITEPLPLPADSVAPQPIAMTLPTLADIVLTLDACPALDN
ncbi:hypothetical protein RI367_007604 [Sorochytrium milnesiophthora]